MASRADRSRYGDDRRDRDRYSGSHRDRRDDRRDRFDDRRERSDRDSYRRRRSRSPPPHRRRSRERHADRYDDRDRGRDDNRDRERDRDRDRDFRDRDYRDRDRERDRERDRDRNRDRRRGSSSATPAVEDTKRNVNDTRNERTARDEKPKQDQKAPVQDKDAEKKSKLARLEEWKKMQLEKKAKQQVGTPTTIMSPTVGAPTPPGASTPTSTVTRETAKAAQFNQTEPGQKISIKLSDSKKTNPLQAKSKAGLLDDEDNEGTLTNGLKPRGLIRLEPSPSEPVEDSAASPEDPAPADEMDLDDDPLDAFMNGLETGKPNGATAPQGILYDDDLEPEQTAVEGEDLLAMAASRKKRKEVAPPDHSKVEYPPFQSNLYIEPQELSNLTPEEVRDLRLELDGIQVKPDDGTVPRPVLKWAQMGLLTATMEVFQQLGYIQPTPIQSQAIPAILSGRNIIGIGKTGSGKTISFGIPLCKQIPLQTPLKSSDGPVALILAPTRELATQIVAELKPFFKASNMKIAGVYGGSSIAEQIGLLKLGGIHCLVATPGRLIDLLQSNSGRVLNLKRVTYCILDEADRMLDMGFEPQVAKILSFIRPDRQTSLFSATFPTKMAALARKAMVNPIEITIGGRSVVAPEITQIITIVPSADKRIAQVLLRLGQVLGEDEDAQVLIFVERQETADDLLSKLLKRGYPSGAIHGAKDQSDRNETITDFKRKIIPVMIATSVAARGLDIKDLKMVINYDVPTHLEDYVHRCGRTGRAGNTGTAVTLLVNPGEERYAVHVAKALRQSGQEVPEDLQQMVAEFDTQVKEGKAKRYDAGFGGSGLDKFDQARKLKEKREKRARKGEFGEEESESESELIMPSVVKKAATPEPTTENTPSAPTEAADEPAYMKLLKQGVVVHKTERPSADPGKKLTPMELVKQKAMEVDQRLSKKGMIHHGQPIDNKGPDAGAYHSTIEINDFPQKARWAVTNRTNVAKILESTGTSITTKGTFYPPGKSPSTEADLPKLYILVEGDTENVVTQAMTELTRLLREGTLAADDAGPRTATGRYSVV